MRLIDADAYKFSGDLIDEPTVDPVFVVRCKDCDNSHDVEKDYLVCSAWGCRTDFDGFCYKGERKKTHEP